MQVYLLLRVTFAVIFDIHLKHEIHPQKAP